MNVLLIVLLVILLISVLEGFIIYFFSKKNKSLKSELISVKSTVYSKEDKNADVKASESKTKIDDASGSSLEHYNSDVMHNLPKRS